MELKNNIRIGFAPTRRDICSREEALRYRKETLSKVIKYGAEIVDIDDINEEGILLTPDDMVKAIKKFKAENVDCIFSPHVNFGTESVIAPLAKEVNKPFLLWGPREDNPSQDCTNLRYTQVGIFATSKILQRLGVPFSYIVNSTLDDKVFERGFDNFVRAANVVKNFRKMKIGQIGVRPGSFWTVICNEGELLEKFNIQVVPFNLEDIVIIVKDLLKNPTKEFKETLNFVKANVKVEISEEELRRVVALKEVLLSIAKEQGISAFAIQCWTSLQGLLGIMPCFANSLMYEERIPVACETDITGAVSAVIAQSASFESPAFFADLTSRHPAKDDVELLWHCGPFPLSLKKENSEARICSNYLFEPNPPGTGDFEIKGGDITIVRFDSLNGKYVLFSGQAKGDEGPKYRGTYLWFKVNNWAKWERKLIYGPYIHHVAAIHGKMSPVLYEAARYIDGLTFDPIEPDESQIIDWLDGGADI